MRSRVSAKLGQPRQASPTPLVLRHEQAPLPSPKRSRTWSTGPVGPHGRSPAPFDHVRPLRKKSLGVRLYG